MVKEAEERNWVDLPPEITSLVFSKLGVVELLSHAQFVCTAWRQLSRDPNIFRSVILLEEDVLESPRAQQKADLLLKEVVHRSCGELIEMTFQGDWCSNRFLNNIAQNTSSSLKSLRLLNLDEITGDRLVEACKKLPLLEQLELDDFDSRIRATTIEQVGQSCSQLKYFRYNNGGSVGRPKLYYEDFAFTIAETMPQLRGLCLCLKYLTSKGLQAIFNKCPHLEYLDLEGCCYSDVTLDLRKVCRNRIIDTKLPRRVCRNRIIDTKLPLPRMLQ